LFENTSSIVDTIAHPVRFSNGFRASFQRLSGKNDDFGMMSHWNWEHHAEKNEIKRSLSIDFSAKCVINIRNYSICKQV
jgi:hypothetical protein